MAEAAVVAHQLLDVALDLQACKLRGYANHPRKLSKKNTPPTVRLSVSLFPLSSTIEEVSGGVVGELVQECTFIIITAIIAIIIISIGPDTTVVRADVRGLDRQDAWNGVPGG